MQFKLTNEYIDQLQELIASGKDATIQKQLTEVHPADIAEIFDEIKLDEASYIYKLLDSEKSADVLVELEEDVRQKLLTSFTSKEIAEDIIENIDSDDAADVIAELPDDKQEEVISHLEDKEQAEDIRDLLTYPDGSAGSLMAKELVKVNENWSITTCIREMRKQAEDLEYVYTIYVVDNNDTLLGRLSLKKLLLSASSARSKVTDIFNAENLITANVNSPSEDVSITMDKYDLVVLPVIDDNGILLGRITIDDVVDVMVEEAEKDYQMASGISEDVESGDSVWALTRARLPWLLIGMVGGLFGAQVIGVFDIHENPEMALFIPLIAAMGGNVGVQSAAIVVQGLANNSLRNENIIAQLLKELGVALLNGIILSLVILGASTVLDYDKALSITVSLALLCVIVFAALFGTMVPLVLDKYKIDPALATGPFVTTANDIVGLIIYFMIGGLIHGML